MPLISSVISWLMKKRMHQIELFIKFPHEVQNEWFKKLISSAKNTEWGKKYGYQDIQTPEQFQKKVPVTLYENLKPYIDRVMLGEKNILWPSDIRWFAKSSGTTADRSKFIPVSQEALEECHFKGGKDLLSIYCSNNPETAIFDGKSLGLGGSHNIVEFNNEAYYGDLSAILMQNLPFWAEFLRTPELKIAIMEEWESKIEIMAAVTKNDNVTNLAGVPSWTLLLLKRILEITGKDNLLEIWPNFELYIHGGVNFNPYRQHFEQLIPTRDMCYLETYNASEGFFGIQDRLNEEGMLLMLDYGIYYEFVPAEQANEENPPTLTLDQVKTGGNYALIISTNAGLWRYMIGDIITFISTNPYRIKVTGRTKSFINAFGEELIVENADQAMAISCEKTGAIINEYTAAPVYFDNENNAAHEWLIEFEQPPHNIEDFNQILDDNLRLLNSDYDAKRYHDMILKPPLIRSLPKGTFYQWMKMRNKLGGQNKVPRLSNNRKFVDEILAMV